MKYLLALEVFENLSTHWYNLKQPISRYLYEKKPEVIEIQKRRKQPLKIKACETIFLRNYIIKELTQKYEI